MTCLLASFARMAGVVLPEGGAELLAAAADAANPELLDVGCALGRGWRGVGARGGSRIISARRDVLLALCDVA
jgi:hypothetical protein